MFGIFKRKPIEDKPLCFHEWRLADAGVDETTDCVTMYFDDYYVIGCEKCLETRKLNEVEYSRVRRSGLLKEAL